MAGPSATADALADGAGGARRLGQEGEGHRSAPDTLGAEVTPRVRHRPAQWPAGTSEAADLGRLAREDPIGPALVVEAPEDVGRAQALGGQLVDDDGV